MFDNLLGQEEVVGRLSGDLAGGGLPSSILFTGPEASGKLTAALELARVLSCAHGAAWNCGCASCARHRVLAHPDLLLLGPRTFPEEIPAALALYERAPSRASAYFLIRALRKLGKRFDPALYEGEESRLAKAAPFLRELEERLDAIKPEAEPGSKAVEDGLAAARAAAEASRKLESLVADTTPIFMVRSAGYWARLAPNGRMKTIVIESADRMLEGSRNALLKILEEPPASLEFVLLTPRRNAMMATILSRVRPYAFKPRSPEDEALVLERVFKTVPARAGAGPAVGGGPAAAARGVARPSPAGAIAAFLHSQRAFPPEEARRRARSFLLAAALRLVARGGRDPQGQGLDPALAFLSSPAAEGDQGFDPALAALSVSGASPAELGDAVLQTLATDTKDFGAKDESFASAFPSFLEALAGLLGEALRVPGAGPEGFLVVEKWARLIRDARLQYETLNRSPGVLAESLLYAMGEIQ